MGKSKISIIIAREFAIRVKKKSFIFTTLLTPLLFAALMVIPSLIAVYSGGEEGQKVAVVDQSGIVMPYMESDSEVIFEEVTGVSVDDLKKDFDNLSYFAVVGISPMDSMKNVSVVTYSKKQMNMDMHMGLGQLHDAANFLGHNSSLRSYDYIRQLPLCSDSFLRAFRGDDIFY
jgi:ABC-2 type transport system permease protein